MDIYKHNIVLFEDDFTDLRYHNMDTLSSAQSMASWSRRSGLGLWIMAGSLAIL